MGMSLNHFLEWYITISCLDVVKGPLENLSLYHALPVKDCKSYAHAYIEHWVFYAWRATHTQHLKFTWKFYVNWAVSEIQVKVFMRTSCEYHVNSWTPHVNFNVNFTWRLHHVKFTWKIQCEIHEKLVCDFVCVL